MSQNLVWLNLKHDDLPAHISDIVNIVAKENSLPGFNEVKIWHDKKNKKTGVHIISAIKFYSFGKDEDLVYQCTTDGGATIPISGENAKDLSEYVVNEVYGEGNGDDNVDEGDPTFKNAKVINKYFFIIIFMEETKVCDISVAPEMDGKMLHAWKTMLAGVTIDRDPAEVKKIILEWYNKYTQYDEKVKSDLADYLIKNIGTDKVEYITITPFEAAVMKAQAVASKPQKKHKKKH